MRHAVHQNLIEYNPADSLNGITTPPAKHHYPALPFTAFPDLQTRIQAWFA